MRTLTEIQRDMLDYVPQYYRDSLVASGLLNAEAIEIAQLNADIYDVLDQFYIDRATWGLARWERIFGVVPEADATYEQRREVLRGKMRGVGKISVSLIENVAEAYANGDVDVAVDSAAYTLTITFVGVFGVPAQLDALKANLRDIIPAHMAIDYVFRFYTYGELTGSGATYASLTGYAYDDIYNRRL
ncbi:putative phage tail protein [Paenibacillus sp. FSL H7-0940]|uniref:putative phage tail protein n=1 Tax=Paenibacillus sp. FSL H7-0940 TaxID=2921443 RepID=UPI0030EF0120